MSLPASARTTPATASSWPARPSAPAVHGLLAVTPYYNKPPQEGLFRHFTAIADATGLPVMLYDIPGRSGVPIDTETLVRLAEHPRIVANKDAKGDLGRASWAIARSGLAWYSGDDMLNLPLLSVGAIGFVSVVGHVVTPELRALIEAYLGGDVQKATEIHQKLLPVFTGMFRTQGVITTKAALALQGLPATRCASLWWNSPHRKRRSSRSISPPVGYSCNHRLHN